MNHDRAFPVVFALEQRGDLVRVCKSLRDAFALIDERLMVETINQIDSGELLKVNPVSDGIRCEPNTYEFRCRIYEAGSWMTPAEIEAFISFARVAAYQECSLRSNRYGTYPLRNLRFDEFVFKHWRIPVLSRGADHDS